MTLEKKKNFSFFFPKYLWLLAPVIICFFVFAKPCLAVNFDIVHSDNSEILSGLRQTFAVNFFPTKNNISGVYLSGYNSGNSAPDEVFVCKGALTYSAFSAHYSDCGTYQQIADITCYMTDSICSFGGAYALTPADEYFLIFKLGTSNIFNRINYDKYPSYYFYGYNFDYSGYYDAPFATIYGDIRTIAPISPAEGQIISTNNVFFMGSWIAPDTNYDNIFYWIHNKDNDTYQLGAVDATTTTGTFLDNKILVNGQYDWTAFFSDDSGNTTATTSPIDFSVNTTLTATSTCLFDMSSCDEVASSTPWWDINYPAIQCGFKKIIVWSVCPDNFSINSLKNSYAELKASFPFNAYFQLTDAVDTAVSTTTLSLNETLKMPFITATGTYYMLPVLASSSMSNLIGKTNADLFRNSITWILWALAGFLVFITIQRI